MDKWVIDAINFIRTQVFLAMVRLGFHCCRRCLGCVQTDATTSNIVAPTMLEPAVHRGKDTTHKSL